MKIRLIVLTEKLQEIIDFIRALVVVCVVVKVIGAVVPGASVLVIREFLLDVVSSVFVIIGEGTIEDDTEVNDVVKVVADTGGVFIGGKVGGKVVAAFGVTEGPVGKGPPT